MAIIKAAVFSKDKFICELEFQEIPRQKDYIHVPEQKRFGWRVEMVIFLPSNSQDWAVVLQLDLSYALSSTVDEPTKSSFHEALGELARERGRKASLKTWLLRTFNEPDKAWQRKKSIWERNQAGETFEVMAEEMGIKVARVKRLASDWARLQSRVISIQEAEREVNE